MQLPDLLQIPYMVLQRPVYAKSQILSGFYLYFGDGIELAVPFFMKFECFSLIVMVFILSNAFILFLHYNSNFDILNQDAYFRMQEGQYHVTVHTQYHLFIIFIPIM